MKKRIFDFLRPLTYKGSHYPLTVMDVEDDKGNVASRNVFADANGLYYSLNKDGTAVPIILNNNLDEVTVTASKRKDNTPAEYGQYLKNYYTSPSINSSDNTRVLNTSHREYNPHLKDAALRGAKSNALWEKEHPNATAWRDVALIAPFAVAAAPALAGAGDAWAGTTLGQGVANGLGILANTAKNSTFLPWLDAAATSHFGAQGLQDVKNGNFTPETAMDLMFLEPIAKPMYDASKDAACFAANWKPFVPRNSKRYYGIVSETCNHIGDAIESGVIRGAGVVPRYQEALNADLVADSNTVTIISKTHEYPMFSKGKPFGESTVRRDFGKPTIVRSKSDTGPIVWQESNNELEQKGQSCIFTPSYYGELNSTPTRYFEYWEPQKIGYIRKNFPVDTNPYHNLMGKGYSVERGNWVESKLGVEGEQFGKYIGSGGEQTVFEDLAHDNKVLKVYHKTQVNDMMGLEFLVNNYLQRNSIPLQEPASFSGYIKSNSNLYPVFSQDKLKPLGEMSNAEYMRTYLPLVQEALNKLGYGGDGVNSEFTNGFNTLIDIKPDNMGITQSNELRFFDVNKVKNR